MTPYPLAGWEYATPKEDYEDGDGVRIVCGKEETPRLSFRSEWENDNDGEAVGCGESFYLSFVRFENGREIDPAPPTEYVEIGTRTGQSGPRGPDWPRSQGEQ